MPFCLKMLPGLFLWIKVGSEIGMNDENSNMKTPTFWNFISWKWDSGWVWGISSLRGRSWKWQDSVSRGIAWGRQAGGHEADSGPAPTTSGGGKSRGAFQMGWAGVPRSPSMTCVDVKNDHYNLPLNCPTRSKPPSSLVWIMAVPLWGLPASVLSPYNPFSDSRSPMASPWSSSERHAADKLIWSGSSAPLRLHLVLPNLVLPQDLCTPLPGAPFPQLSPQLAPPQHSGLVVNVTASEAFPERPVQNSPPCRTLAQSDFIHSIYQYGNFSCQA